MSRLFLFVLLFFNVVLQAQKVKVLEKESELPIKGVAVYNEDKSILLYTDSDGVVDISDFNEKDILFFSHITYVDFELLKKRLKGVKYKVFLRKNSEQLDEVVLSVSRGKESRNRVAEQIAVFTKNQIQKQSPQTSADLLASTPGVKVQRSQFGGGSPVLRGMEANRVLLVVDGVRMNNAIYRKGHLQNAITVSPTILERTEVVFGPSSVIYGSDALGGVIHFYTKTPKVSEDNEVNATLFSRFSSVNNEITTQATTELRFKKWASFTSVSHSKFGDLKMGKNRRHNYSDWGKVFVYSENSRDYYSANPKVNNNPEVQKNTGYSQTDVLQKLFFPISDQSELIFNFQYSESSDIPRFDRLTQLKEGRLKFAEWYYGPQKRVLISSQFHFDSSKKWMKKGELTFAFQDLRESRVQRRFGSLDRSYRNEKVNVFSVNGDFSVPFSKSKNRVLSYGFELAYNKVNSDSFGKELEVSGHEITGFTNDFIVQSRYPDGGSNYTSSAVYVDYRQDLSPKSTLNSGIRLTNTQLNAKWIDDTFITLPDNDISLSNSAVTATVGYVFKPDELWQLNGVLSSGFRSPNVDDIGKIREKNGFVSVPNIYLKPEFAYNAEAGIVRYFNNRRFRIGANAYYTLLDNYIVREVFDLGGAEVDPQNVPVIVYDGELVTTVANVNKGTAYVVGSTFSFEGKLAVFWKAKGSVTYTKGRTYDTEMPLSSIPPVFGNVEVGYAKNKFETALSFRFNGKKRLKDYNLEEGIDNIQQTPIDASTGSYVGTPSWNTLNFFSKYAFNRHVELQLMVDNIFDNHYKEFASGISAAGRNVSASVYLIF